MVTIVISDALDKTTSSFQSNESKDIRAMIDIVAEECGTKIDNVQVDRGVVTLDLENDKVAAKFITDLNAEGFNAEQKVYRDALSERIARRRAVRKTVVGQ